MPKAISYVRFSSGTQAKGSTLERQNALISKWLEEHPEVSLSSLSQQDLGRSAYKGDHLDHGLGKILEAIEQKKIVKGDYVLVEAIDRIGRLSPTDMIQLIQNIVSSGVTIVTLEDDVEYSKEGFDTAYSDLYMLIGKIQQAHDYSKNLSRRITAAYESKRRKAKKGESIRIATSFWLTTTGSLIPEKAEFVKECIDLYLRGYGTRRILIELDSKYSFAKDIHPSTIKRWLTNKALLGTWTNKGDEISGVFDALVDEPTYYKIQREFRRRAIEMSPEETYGLSGLVICGECASRYYFRRKRHKDYIIIYSNCSTYLKRGKLHCSNNRAWPYEVLQAIFHWTYDDTLANTVWDDTLNQLSEKADTLRSKLEDVEHKREKVLKLYMDAQSDDALYKETLDDLKIESDAIRKDLIFLEATIEKTVFMSEDYSNKDIISETLGKADTQFTEIQSDPIYLRDHLKKIGYRITLNCDIAEARTNIGIERYSLKKRSQLYGCYIVELVLPKHSMIDGSTDEPMAIPSETMYLAISRKGIVCSEPDIKSLSDTLSQRTESDEYLLEFPQ